MLTTTSLNEGWTLHPGAIPATVPGGVLADLIAARLVDDPRLADHEAAARWVGWTTWEYRRTVEVSGEAQHHELCFDGLDTVAEVRWDGQVVARTRNMHRRHRVDLTGRADPGPHQLSVRLGAPEVEGRAARERVGGARPNAYDRPYEALRTMACKFGWDWGPDFPDAGLWRDVRWEQWSGARVRDVLVDTRRAGPGERWRADVRVLLDGDAPATVSATVASGRASAQVDAGAREARLAIDVEDPELWWPHTHGSPALHALTVTVTDDAGVELDAWRRPIGFREIALDTSEDAAGSRFVLVVNDRPVFARGVNWIPDSCLPGTTTPPDVVARLADAVDAHQNLVRVWGGGTYESDAFYRRCDELGLLVWQDFAFACAFYSEDAELADEVEAEARDAVTRLQHHPCLALWCGNNENIWAHEEWDWKGQLGGRTWGAGYYFDLLPRVVAELDAGRPYWPGTPWSGEGLPANDDAHGTSHLWHVWNGYDHERYWHHRPRFAAEFGYQGPPTHATMAAALGADHLSPDDPLLQARQKAGDGMAKLERGLVSHGGAARDADSWWWRTQQIQAEALRVGVGHLRALMPHCMGSVWWQLNDCWPVISWSVVDSAGRRKPAWYALRAVSADRVVLVTGRTPRLVAVNDTDERWHTRAFVDAMDAEGGRSRVEVDVLAEPRSAVELLSLAQWTDRPAVLRPGTAEGPGQAWVGPGFREACSAATAQVRAEPTPSGWRVRVTASGPVPLVDTSLFVDRLDPGARVDDQLRTLFAGESHTFTVTGARGADPAAFTGAPVLRWVGDDTA